MRPTRRSRTSALLRPYGGRRSRAAPSGWRGFSSSCRRARRRRGFLPSDLVLITPYSFLASTIAFLLAPCSNLLDRPQNRLGGVAIAPLDLDRWASKLVFTRLHRREIHPFYNPDSRLRAAPGASRRRLCETRPPIASRCRRSVRSRTRGSEQPPARRRLSPRSTAAGRRRERWWTRGISSSHSRRSASQPRS